MARSGGARSGRAWSGGLMALMRAACLAAATIGSAAATERPAIEEAFEAAQWAYLSSAGKALRQLGLRAASGSPELAELIRRRQDVLELIARREAALVDTADGAALVTLRGEIDSLRAEVADGGRQRLSRNPPIAGRRRGRHCRPRSPARRPAWLRMR